MKQWKQELEAQKEHIQKRIAELKISHGALLAKISKSHNLYYNKIDGSQSTSNLQSRIEKPGMILKDGGDMPSSHSYEEALDRKPMEMKEIVSSFFGNS